MGANERGKRHGLQLHWVRGRVLFIGLMVVRSGPLLPLTLALSLLSLLQFPSPSISMHICYYASLSGVLNLESSNFDCGSLVQTARRVLILWQVCRFGRMRLLYMLDAEANGRKMGELGLYCLTLSSSSLIVFVRLQVLVVYLLIDDSALSCSMYLFLYLFLFQSWFCWWS